MRGAVSVALVYYYYDPDGKTYDRQRSTLIAMTLAVVLISTLFFGAVTKPLLDLLLGPQGTGLSQPCKVSNASKQMAYYHEILISPINVHLSLFS